MNWTQIRKSIDIIETSENVLNSTKVSTICVDKESGGDLCSSLLKKYSSARQKRRQDLFCSDLPKTNQKSSRKLDEKRLTESFQSYVKTLVLSQPNWSRSYKQYLDKVDRDGIAEEKVHAVIPEITRLNPFDLKPSFSYEREGAISSFRSSGKSPKEWAGAFDFTEPAKVSLFNDGSLVVADGHHRQLAAQILGRSLPVTLQAINAEQSKIDELAANQPTALAFSDERREELLKRLATESYEPIHSLVEITVHGTGRQLWVDPKGDVWRTNGKSHEAWASDYMRENDIKWRGMARNELMTRGWTRIWMSDSLEVETAFPKKFVDNHLPFITRKFGINGDTRINIDHYDPEEDYTTPLESGSVSEFVQESRAVNEETFKYGMMLRPAGPNTVEPGYISYDPDFKLELPPNKDHFIRHGVVTYDHELPDERVKKWELIPIENEGYHRRVAEMLAKKIQKYAKAGIAIFDDEDRLEDFLREFWGNEKTPLVHPMEHGKVIELAKAMANPTQESIEENSKVEHSKHSTQVNLEDCPDSEPLMELFKSIQDKISEEDTYEEEGGKEDEVHVTLLYGLTDENDLPEAKKMLSLMEPFEMEFGEISSFRNEDKPFDVLIIEMKGEGLHECNRLLKMLTYENSYPDYKPHMTLAYVQKGVGKDLEGSCELTGKKALVTKAEWSHKDHSRVAMPIGVQTKSIDEAREATGIKISVPKDTDHDIDFIAQIDGKVVGRIFGGYQGTEDGYYFDPYDAVPFVDQLKEIDQIVDLTDLHVDPAYRGKGIADALMKKFVVAAKKYNAPILILASPYDLGGISLNNLVSLYAKHGFKEIIRYPRHHNSLMMMNGPEISDTPYIAESMPWRKTMNEVGLSNTPLDLAIEKYKDNIEKGVYAGMPKMNEHWENEIRNVFTNVHEKPIFRMIRADKVNTNELGIYWTYDPDAVSAYWGDPDLPIKILVAQTSQDQIDWEATVEQYMKPQYAESEVRLKKNPKLIEIFDDFETFWKSKYFTRHTDESIAMDEAMNLKPMQWTMPTEEQLNDEFHEGEIDSLLLTMSYPQPGEKEDAFRFFKANLEGPIEIDPKDLKGKNAWRFTFPDYHALRKTVTSYGGPKDPDSMVRKVQSGGSLPMPVVIRRVDGTLELAGGATRTSIALLAGQKIQALVLDEKKTLARKILQKKKSIEKYISKSKNPDIKKISAKAEQLSKTIPSDKLLNWDNEGDGFDGYHLGMLWGQIRDYERKIAGEVAESRLPWREIMNESAYHGTQRIFDKFTIGKHTGSFNMIYGPGAYLSSNPREATTFSQGKSGRYLKTSNVHIYNVDNLKFWDSGTDWATARKIASILKVPGKLDRFSHGFDALYRAMEKADNFDDLSKQEKANLIAKTIQDLGFDGVKFRAPGNHEDTWYVVYSVDKLKHEFDKTEEQAESIEEPYQSWRKFMEAPDWAHDVGGIRAELGEIEEIYKDFDHIYSRFNGIVDVLPPVFQTKMINALGRAYKMLQGAESLFREVTHTGKAPRRNPIVHSQPTVSPKQEMERISMDLAKLSVRVRNVGQATADVEHVEIEHVRTMFEKASEILRKTFVEFERHIP
jgi:GNAT superfamily N-acetyltransferase/2'-5' RNA ligase